MKIYEFVLLSEAEKANVVWGGVFVSAREEEHYNVLLYHLNCFFVEVYYNFRENTIVKFRPFRVGKLLEPYIEKVQLTELEGLL